MLGITYTKALLHHAYVSEVNQIREKGKEVCNALPFSWFRCHSGTHL